MKNKFIDEMPFVSVVMPLYNAEQYLKQALDSLLAQTYKNFEIIIINDASTDGSLKIVNDYRNKYPQKIRLISLIENLGYSGGEAASNVGIAKAKGEFIAKMDADDVSFPDRLEAQVKFLVNNPNIYLIGTQAIIIDEKNNIIGKRIVPVKHGDIYKNFYLKNCVINPSVMFRRPDLRKAFYEMKYEHFNDYYTFFMLMIRNKKIANLNGPLIYYRMYTKNCTITKIKEKNISNTKIKKAFIKDYNYSPCLFHLMEVFLKNILINLLPERMLIFMYFKFKLF